MEFCKAFNAKTNAKDQEGLIIPVVITIYPDRSLHLSPRPRRYLCSLSAP